jgi:ribosomal protein S12 methylthiotransferase
MAEKQKKISVGFIALGCPKNIVDSERMLAEIVQGGFIISSDPRKADVVVINTCAFIAPAKAESLETIKKWVGYKNRGSRKPSKVIVAGCLPERLGCRIDEELYGVDAVVGLGQRDNIAAIIRKTLSSEQPAAYPGETSQQTSQSPDDRTRLLINPGHYAYLRISEGCNHRCSFCTIPAIRGNFRSKSPELVMAEACELVGSGVVELNLIAQDTASYGKDLQMRDGLPGLIKNLDTIESLAWIRLLYLYPTGISDELIETIAASKKVVHYLDIPIQHVNGEILKSMRRPGSQIQLRSLIEKIRSALSDVVLRTTLIVGYPGETEEQFEELLDFVKWAQFDALGCFIFYPEADTDAAALPDQIPLQVKQQRLEELMLLQQKIAFNKNQHRIGSTITCMVDSVDKDGSAIGRFYGQAPDIDSLCIIRDNSQPVRTRRLRPGQFIKAKVVGTRDYDLVVS